MQHMSTHWPLPHFYFLYKFIHLPDKQNFSVLPDNTGLNYYFWSLHGGGQTQLQTF